ncbi:MAG: hypothetical protein HY674_13890 [Chloroflexi bacterium]|nr:hypothetical protein [Chloroflexota bacterium]
MTEEAVPMFYRAACLLPPVPWVTHLVYGASGNRSRQTVEVMQRPAFMQVYSMTQGFSTFVALAGAAAFLEP